MDDQEDVSVHLKHYKEIVEPLVLKVMTTDDTDLLYDMTSMEFVVAMTLLRHAISVGMFPVGVDLSE